MHDLPLEPEASSFIESLRDIGYTFETAIADIIDNSIYAKAKKIRLFFEYKDTDSYIAILDDGESLSSDQLIKAMKLGSTNPKQKRSVSDLGRFGLGLKTASFSQCRCVTVVANINGRQSACQWDIDHIATTGNWLLRILNEQEISELPCIDRLDSTGTMVLWQKTDRIIDSTETELTESVMYKKIDSARAHLELVFHRFLKSEPGHPKIEISINNTLLEPFNPFNENNIATQTLAEETIWLNGSPIHIQPYILPHHSKVSAVEYEQYAGEGDYLNNQGFYVYRNRRLLISGTWFRLIPKKETTKLARVKIDLPNNMDDLWQIDVKKSMAFPPTVIRNRLKKIIDRIAGSSIRVYASRGHKVTKTAVPFWERYHNKNAISYSINKKHPLITHFSEKLDVKTQEEFFDLLNLLEKYFPVDAFFADLADNPKQMNSMFDDRNDIIERAQKYYELILKPSGISGTDKLKALKSTEPFSQYPDIWETFLLEQENQ